MPKSTRAIGVHLRIDRVRLYGGKTSYGVRLLKAFEQWSKNRRVAEINFGINSIEEAREMQRLGSFAVRMGYSKVGENYVRAL